MASPTQRRSPSTKDTPTGDAAAAAESVSSNVHARQAPLFDYLTGFHAVHLLAFGEETGAFRQLANAGAAGLNVDEFADRQGWVTGYARGFLEAAFALGVLDLASEAGVTPRSRYRLAPPWAELLADEGSPAYMGDTARLSALAAKDYGRFPDLHRTGKTFPWALHGEEFLRLTAASTRGLPELALGEAFPRLPELARRLQEGAYVLDIGCGAGWAIARLAEEFPKSRFVGVDAEPNAVEMAKTLLAFRHLHARAEARLVRGEELEYEAEFDVATMFLVLHSIPPKHRATALRHAHGALKRDGLLLVYEEALPETPNEYRGQRRFTVLDQWLEGTWGHEFLRPGELRALLEENGFRVERELALGRDCVFLARKVPVP